MSISGIHVLLEDGISEEEFLRRMAYLNTRHAANRRYGTILGIALGLVLSFLVLVFFR